MISSSKLKSVDFYRSNASICYLSVSTATSVIVDKSTDGDYLRIDFNMRLNLTKTVRKFSIDSSLRPTGAEFHSEPAPKSIKHDNEVNEESIGGALELTAENFDKYAHQ
ncbi:unnamed protein product [Sphenostylis stenocarpa]|uniref:Uncharacterized protein n=1 Tax=Sphenostylis stenocarpa TaxID=92480 RepID=A0AA86SFK1_9FABA|nr:unnamed protein product [Sphenostylis stenocarpa]